jgi:drug/metabolite transporter (DMT)-like permease
VSRRGIVRCGLAAILFGISAPAAARLTDDLSAFTLAGLLYLGAALAVVPVVGSRRPSAASLRRSTNRLALAIVFGGAIGPVLLAVGLADVSAATSSLLLNLELVFTTLVAAVVFREHIGRRVALGTTLVLVAGVLLGWAGRAEVRVGALFIAAACLCWAIDNSVTAALDELAPAHITLAKGVIAGSVNLAIGLIGNGAPPIGPASSALLVGAFGYGISITLWVSGARDLGAARGQLVFATAPFVGAVVAWTVFADAITVRELTSLLVALSGVTLVLRSDHEHVHEHAEIEHDHEHVHDDGHHTHVHVTPIGRHQHPHRHERLVHSHPHVPDLHHRHDHGGASV